MNSRFRVISTFSGCGGSSLGYRLAGGKVLLAVEWDANAMATYRLNFPATPVYHGDIARLSVDECMRLAGVGPGELDILDGSPPCQGFSTAGRRQLDDDRNQLFREYVRLLRGLRPRVFVMENVSGMVKGKMKLIFAEIMQELKASGYRVRARLLNAMYFGVPQSRERMIFIGVRNDLGIEPAHPQARTAPMPLYEALRGLDGPGLFKRPGGRTAQLAALVRPGEDGGDVRRRLGFKDRDFSLIRLAWHKPCCTVPKTIRPEHFSGLLHPDQDRFLGIDELKRVASFPDDFQFTGAYEEQWARIGNSVPPGFMRAIAEHIRDNILSRAQGDAAVKMDA